MARKVQIAPGLSLDPDYFGAGTFALLAKKGAGKSYTSRVLAEEMWATGVPFALFDPMGVCWGLRSSADGTDEGIPVAIFGGKHGDAPLERGAGRLMADLAIDEGLSMILDFSEFGSHAAEREFAQAFLDRLYFRNDRLYHLLIDEADLFAPQKPQKGAEALLGVMDNVVRRGRNRGIGVTLMTQRPAVLNKDVLTQIDGLVAMRVIGLPDREAVDHWVMGHGEDQDQARQVKGSLAGLSNGESWWWIPELGILKRVQIRASRTFDSSPSRTRSTKAVQPKGFADVDMGAIEAKITETITRAKADDPKELRKQLAQLQRQIRELESRPSTVETTEVEVEVPVIPQFVRARQNVAEQLAAAAAHAADQAQSAVAELSADLRDFERNGNGGGHQPVRARAEKAPRAETPAAPPRPAPRPASPPVDSDLTGPQQRVLDAVAWLEQVGFAQPTKIQVGFIAGYRVGKRVGGTFGNILGQLRAMGLIDYPAQGQLELTGEGRAIATPPDIERTTDGLQRAIHARLSGPESKVLAGIIDEYPHALTKQDAGQRAGYQVGDRVGGTFGNILGKLRSLGLIDYPQQGSVCAQPILFL